VRHTTKRPEAKVSAFTNAWYIGAEETNAGIRSPGQPRYRMDARYPFSTTLAL